MERPEENLGGCRAEDEEAMGLGEYEKMETVVKLLEQKRSE